MESDLIEVTYLLRQIGGKLDSHRGQIERACPDLLDILDNLCDSKIPDMCDEALELIRTTKIWVCTKEKSAPEWKYSGYPRHTCEIQDVVLDAILFAGIRMCGPDTYECIVTRDNTLIDHLWAKSLCAAFTFCNGALRKLGMDIDLNLGIPASMIRN